MPEDSLDSSTTAKNLGIAVGRIARGLRPLNGEVGTASELAFTEILLLSRLERDGATSPGSLADVEHVTPLAAEKMLSALEGQALVKRTRGPADGQRVIVTITHAGRRALEDRARSVTDHLRCVFDEDLGPTERGQIAATLPLLEHVADRMWSPTR